MSSRDGYRADITKNCCEQCRMMVPTCDVCKARNAEIVNGQRAVLEQGEVIEKLMNELAEKQKYILSLERELSKWKKASVGGIESLVDSINELLERRETLLEVIKLVYRKHHLNDDSIGWDELSTVLHNSICNALGDDGFIKWVQAIQR